VTLDEALAELRIDHRTEPEEARRAYLRLLKERKPEVDPDGFQRLRAAYDLVRNFLGWRVAASAPVRDVPAENVADGNVAVQKRLAESVAADGMQPADGVTPADCVRQPDPDGERLEMIGALLRAKKWSEAAEPLAAHFEIAAGRPDMHVPNPGATVKVLLRLHEKGLLQLATRLDRAFTQWLDANGGEVKVLAGSAPQWAIVRDLGALPGTLSPEVRRAMARAGRAREYDDAMAALSEMGRRDRRAAKRDARLLRARKTPFTTKVAGLLAPTWLQQVAQRKPTRFGTQWRYVWIASVLLSMGSRLVCTSDPSRHDDRVLPAGSPTLRWAIEAQALAEEGENAGESDLTAEAFKLREVLARGDCDEAPILSLRVSAMTANPTLKARSRALSAHVIDACNGRSQSRP
jgi:hypothetical protein